MAQYWTNEQMIVRLRKMIGKPRKQGVWAHKHGIGAAFLSMVLAGKRPLSATIAAAMGYEKRTYYVKRIDVLPRLQSGGLLGVDEDPV